MSYVSQFALSDQTKSDVRNYAMVAGFMAWFMWETCTVVSNMSDPDLVLQMEENSMTVKLVASFVLVIAGVELAMMHRRDMTSMLFIVLATKGFMEAVGGDYCALPGNIMLIVIGIIFLTTRDEQRWICATVSILAGMYTFNYNPGTSWPITIVALVSSIISLYATICIIYEKRKLPFRDYLTTDDGCPENDGAQMDFKNAGSALGYSLFAIYILGYILYYLGKMSHQSVIDAASVIGPMMVATGLLVLIVAKTHFTPFAFIIIGMTLFMGSFLDLTNSAVILFFLVIGVLNLLRNPKRHIPTVMLIIFAIALIVIRVTGDVAPMYSVYAALLGIPFLILVYMGASLFSKTQNV